MKRVLYILGVMIVAVLLVSGMFLAALSSDRVETAAVQLATAELSRALGTNAQVGGVGKPTAEIANSREGMQLSFFQLDDPILCQVRDEILGIDVNNLTPLEALNKLNDIKKIVSGK